jgi:hypothetical protein
LIGGRHWQDRRPVEREVRRLVKKHGENNLLIISGGAPGADTLAEICGKDNNVHVARVDALWETRHRSAGPQRNSVMVAMEPDECIAFHVNIAKSTGTKDTLKKCRSARIPTKVVSK